MRILTLVLMIFIVFASCRNIFNSGESTVNSQNTSVSRTDSSMIDSMMEYYYYSVSYFQRAAVMQGMVFFLEYNQKLYLISALHNFTGVDPDSRKSIKGLIHYPTDIWVGQPSWVDWRFRNNHYLYNNKDSIQSYANLYKGKYYNLYNHSNALFIEGYGGTNRDNYDLGAYNINDSTQLPRHILYFDKKWGFDTIHIGDTVFYCGLRGDEYSHYPDKFIGRIIKTPSNDDPYISSDVFSRPGSSGAAVFKISNHNVSLIGLITRGNADENIVLITPFKYAFSHLKL